MKRIMRIILQSMLMGGIMLTLISCSSREQKYEDIDEFSKKVTLEQLKKVKVEHGVLIEAGIYTGGGMAGDSNSSSIRLNSDGQIIYTAEKSPMHHIPIRGYEYLVKDQTILDRLNEYIREHNLSVWDKLPFDDEFMALDAPSTSISFVFNDESVGGASWSMHRISYDNVIPEGGMKVLDGFNDLFYEALKDAELQETYLLNDGERLYSGRNIENTDAEAKMFLMGIHMDDKNGAWGKIGDSRWICTETIEGDKFTEREGDLPDADGEVKELRRRMDEAKRLCDDASDILK